LSEPDKKPDVPMSDYLKAQSDAMSKTRTLLDQMRTEMSANRSAPKLLGVLELNEAFIQTIIASISTAVTGFVFAFVSGVMTDIQVGTIDTYEPTYAPTMEPTF